MIQQKQKILLLVSHPDDESIGAGILLQRQPMMRVVFCTSGAPNAPYIWLRYGYPGRCARIREREARAALGLAGHTDPVFLRFRDGGLYRSIRKLHNRVLAIVNEFKPDILLTHAYEGGHPDHDVCARVAASIGQLSGTPVWEAPYYHADPAGSGLVHQHFLGDAGQSVTLTGSKRELAAKRRMFATHVSQRAILDEFDPARELFRPQPEYDFSAPPSPWMTASAIHALPAEKLLRAFRRLTE